MRRLQVHRFLAVAFALALVAPCAAIGHGVVGARFFPATIASDDPFAADELALPTLALGNHQTDVEFEYSKTIFSHFSLSFGGGYSSVSVPDSADISGWNNIEITPTWQFATDADSEFVASLAMSFEIGGSGAAAVAERFTTYTPKLLFGKGFGDLPDAFALLRPLAVTGSIGYAIPGTTDESRAIEWGGAVEYSLLYLQTEVRNQGFGQFVAHLTPVVEFALTSPTEAGGTTDTINPGLIWSGRYVQLAVEASIPVNHASGDTVGVLLQLHFYIDDILPHSLGTPLFGDRR